MYSERLLSDLNRVQQITNSTHYQISRCRFSLLIVLSHTSNSVVLSCWLIILVYRTLHCMPDMQYVGSYLNQFINHQTSLTYKSVINLVSYYSFVSLFAYWTRAFPSVLRRMQCWLHCVRRRLFSLVGVAIRTRANLHMVEQIIIDSLVD